MCIRYDFGRKKGKKVPDTNFPDCISRVHPLFHLQALA
jgi:hypothetical protein